MIHDTTIIRTATIQQVECLLGWAHAEGWNPGLDDAAMFYSADPEGFLLASYDGIPAAGISVVKQGPAYGFLGLYICHPHYRGKGLGWAIWQAGMQYLDGRSIGLDGVVAQQDNYRKSGFQLAYRNIRYEGSANTVRNWRIAAKSSQQSPILCRPIQVDDWPDILALDRQVHGYPRQRLLEHWLAPAPTRLTLISVVDDTVQGFGTIRACHRGFKIGPLISTTPQTAKTMLVNLVSRVHAEHIIVDVPEPNQHAMSLVQQAGLEPFFETARMYRGETPTVQLEHLFGVTSFELG